MGFTSTTAVSWMLEVRKLWGDTILDVREFRPASGRLCVGEGDRAEFFIPEQLIPDKVFPVAHLEEDEIRIALPPRSSGELRLCNGNTFPLAELGKKFEAYSEPGLENCKVLSLPDRAIATVHFGSLGLQFRRVQRPQGIMSKLSSRIDFTFLNVALVVAFLFGAIVSTFHLRPRAVQPSEENLRINGVPPGIRAVIFSLPNNIPKPELKASLSPDLIQAGGLAPRHSGPEGQMGQPGMPNLLKRSARKAKDPSDKEFIKTQGIFHIMGRGPTAGIAMANGGNGLGGDLQDAIGNMDGAVAGPSGGVGGLGLKGTQWGGGGFSELIGIGDPGSNGRFRSMVRTAQNYQSKNFKSNPRDIANITIDTGPVQYRGSLTMEEIRTVIEAHKDQIKWCYSKELTLRPDLQGKITMNFVINERGYVSLSKVAQTSVHSPSLESCMSKKIKTWKFPSPRGGGEVTVNYPFIFVAPK